MIGASDTGPKSIGIFRVIIASPALMRKLLVDARIGDGCQKDQTMIRRVVLSDLPPIIWKGVEIELIIDASMIKLA